MRYLAATLVLMAYLFLCLICWFIYRQRNRSPHFITPDNNIAQTTALLITYASQTGKAEEIALRSAQQLQQANLAVNLLPMNKINRQILANTKEILFVVSTYGEGEPPDNGASFLRRYLSASSDIDLSHLQFGVLALGDRDYLHFCGFGHALNHGLHHLGAKSLFDLIEVDKNDESALRHWQYYLGQLSGETNFPDWNKPTYNQWRLHTRKCLNPVSLGKPAFHLQLIPAEVDLETQQWTAGDIAEIGPCNSVPGVEAFINAMSFNPDEQLKNNENLMQVLLRRQLPKDGEILLGMHGMSLDAVLQQLPELPHREYSIASLPQDRTLDLLVRQQCQADGSPGIGSGWLTEYSQIGGDIALRIRPNSRFHPPQDDVPMILIGNGTGLAGLRAHIRARIQLGRVRNWLIFGERNAAHDFFFAEEILLWKKNGHLHTLDLAFSRDQAETRYVQNVLLDQRKQVVQWVEQGAAIYVCGSLHGMAQGVDDALINILGAEIMEALTDTGRYCRDVY